MKRFLNWHLTSIIIWSILIIIGCGYHFGPGGENIDKNIRTVFVDNFQNNTSEAHIEAYLRKAFIDELIKTNAFKLAPSRDSADAVLKGNIKTFALQPIAYRSDNIAAIQRIHINMEIYFEDGKTKKSIWSDRNFSAMEDYNVDNLNLLITENARKNTLIRLSNNAAERAFRMILSGF